MITLLISEAQRAFLIKKACEQLKMQCGEIPIDIFDAVCDMPNHELFMFNRFLDAMMELQ